MKLSNAYFLSEAGTDYLSQAPSFPPGLLVRSVLLIFLVFCFVFVIREITGIVYFEKQQFLTS
jgi:hypothetical protein